MKLKNSNSLKSNLNKQRRFQKIPGTRGKRFTRTYRFFCIAVLMLTLLTSTIKAGHNFSVTSQSSDYKIVVTYSELHNEPCNCSNTRSITAAKENWQSGDNWWSVSGVAREGTYDRIVGPSTRETYYITAYYNGKEKRDGCAMCADFGVCKPKNCSKHVDTYNAITGSTRSIRPPKNVSASDETYDNKIVITWDKGTDIPDSKHKYKIYRSNVLLATVDGNVRSYTHSGLKPGNSGTYYVRTFTNQFSTGDHESSSYASGSYDTGSTYTIGFSASDGAHYNTVKLEWKDVSSRAENIRIERSIPGSNQLEELDILNKNATAFSDADGIPGYQYTYYITPIKSGITYETESNTGYSKPNGILKGKVQSIFGAGVRDATIDVTVLTPISGGGASLPSGCSKTYCATTDADGYFEVKNIYYQDEAKFMITASKSTPIPHDITPDTIYRTLDLNSKTSTGLNFTDNTVFTVGGKVIFPNTGSLSDCGVQKVEILINGGNRGIFTDSDGNWSFAIEEEGTYTFQPTYKNHSFRDANGDTATTVLIKADKLNLNFTDVQTDTLQVVVQGGCDASLGDSASVRVTSPGNCYDQTFYTDANGLLSIPNLAARKYSVQVTGIYPNNSNIMDQIGNIPVELDLTERDTATVITENVETNITPADTLFLPNGEMVITPADTAIVRTVDTTVTDVIAKARFIYRSPLNVNIAFSDAGAEEYTCSDPAYGSNIIVMNQDVRYNLQIEINESIGNCPIDSGTLKIYDFVSDRESVQEFPIRNGVVNYDMMPGIPEVSSSKEHNHQKLFYMVVETDFLDPVPITYWIFVEGNKSNAPSFTTRSPEIPMIILHDPPGDNSYSYIEKGTEIKYFERNEIVLGGEGGVFGELLIGAKVLTPFSSNGAGTTIDFSVAGGRDNFDRDGFETTVSFNETFSTSDAENLTGYPGDVYIGAAYNQEYSLAENLTWDKDSCKADYRIVPNIAVTGFATTFVYTEGHIKNVLLPTLDLLKNSIMDGKKFADLSAEDQEKVNTYIADSALWTSILTKNDSARDELAVFKENISFSAGAEISREFTSSRQSYVTYEYNKFVNTELAIGAKIDNESGAWFDSKFGVMAKFRYSNNKETGDDTLKYTTTGFILDDNDIGDFFSIDIKEDTAYGVPAFKLKLGTTSCPHEDGTQPRDMAQLGIDKKEVSNVPASGKATFKLDLKNLSESFETREYHLRVIPTSNPDGATIRLGGQIINTQPISYFLESRQTISAVLTVERGPIASTYPDLAIMMYPPCEYELWENNGSITSGDTMMFTVNFETECISSTLHLPGDDWLVNQSNNDVLPIAFTGYDINNPVFESLTLQYKKKNE
ncbi:MAG: fibronectin type III domain-containing protein, partial [Bacteroidales bacterium]|nr:fibronectin type III domain-containing protein [Bacteroidales bacterium]